MHEEVRQRDESIARSVQCATVTHSVVLNVQRKEDVLAKSNMQFRLGHDSLKS